MDTDVYYTVHTATETLSSGFALSGPDEINNLTRGETATFNLHFPGSDSELLVKSDEAHTIPGGTTEIYATKNVEENGTLNVEGTLILTGGDNRDTFQQYADHAGAFSTLETLDNTQRFREQIPANADVDSILLGFEPSNTLRQRGINGVWGLVTSGSDTRPRALSDTRFEVEVRVLAEYQDYTDRSALKNDLLV